MSKIVYVCFKEPDTQSSLKKDIENISKRIMPNNINPAEPKIIEKEGIVYGLINPVESIEENDQSVLLGKTFADDEKWWEPLQKHPDGSFALFRSNKDKVEVVTDVVGSRSVWYYKDDKMFIASTSQRAIIMLIKSFQFNPQVLPWILSSGGLGFSNAWDKRIRYIPADSSVILDRNTWTITLKNKPVEFSASKESDEKHEEDLSKAFEDTFKAINLDYSKWVLPLSGGYDSRSILCFLNHYNGGVKDLKAITWGLESARNKKGNDAYVADKVAKHFRLDHRYFPTDRDEESLEEILNRFIVCGEGRIDHIAGYMDGFKIWKTIFDNNVAGIIRGDEGFGYPPVDSDVHVRKLLGIPLCEDYSNLKDYEQFGLPKQEIPEYLQRKEGETLSTWRDRLYHGYRIPVVLAALTDLKLPYVELINPLLGRKLIYQVRRLPDHLRTDKVLFKKLADNISPKIPYATGAATETTSNILTSPKMVELLKGELSSSEAKEVFSDEFLNYLTSNIKVKEPSEQSKSASYKAQMAALFKRFAPRWLHLKVVRKIQKSTVIGFNLLALRAYIAIKMYKLLQEDAAGAFSRAEALTEDITL